MIRLIRWIFGHCVHSKLSLPLGGYTDPYRSCVKCGARRSFNPNTWETYGRFYYPKTKRT